MAARGQRRGAALRRLFFALVVLPMLGVFPYLRAVNNPNEFSRVFTAMAIVENHTFAVDEQIRMYGWINDLTAARKTGGHQYMVKAPGIVYAGVPGYFLFSKVVAPILGKHYPGVDSSQEARLWWLMGSTWALRLFTSQIPCFLFLLWFEKYLRAFTSDQVLRLASVAACGLGTNYLAYTHMFASHAQYAALAFLAFGLVERERRLSSGDVRRMRLSRIFLAGFCASAIVALEYHALFLALVLSSFAALVLWRPTRSFVPTRLLAFAAGGLVNVPPMLYFHWKAYGNPLTPGHQMLESEQFAREHSTGLWGVVWPTWEHIRDLAVSPDFGFFGMSPFMWLGVLGIPFLLVSPNGGPMHRRTLRIVTVVWALCGTLLFLVNAGIIEWRAGWTIGPRYLAACPPFFALGAACALERFAYRSKSRRAIARGIGGGLALASVIAIGVVGIHYDTLPTDVRRPFPMFTAPMAILGLVPHHVGEWVGWDGTWFWYVAAASLVAAPIVVGLWRSRGVRLPQWGAQAVAFVIGAAVGLAPTFTPPEDGSKFFVLHPSVRGFLVSWEPTGRDRLTTVRNEAERYGGRGPGPCLWLKLAALDRVAGNDVKAAQDEARASGASRRTCPRDWSTWHVTQGAPRGRSRE